MDLWPDLQKHARRQGGLRRAKYGQEFHGPGGGQRHLR